MADSASMKSIAVLTMVFLPGTAVASFFSMSLFNWSSDGEKGLSSRWLWVFFVVAVPLTIAVLVLWYVWVRRVTQTRLSMTGPSLSSQELEMKVVRPGSKYSV